MSDNVIHKKIILHGQVQGVFFRQTARELAHELGLHGFIKNRTDGTVEIEVEGSSELVNKFVNWCHVGPEAANVEQVESEEIPVSHLSGFSIQT
jgi:acylphosphatase